MRTWEEKLTDLAQRQHGNVARFQAERLGVTADEWRSAQRTRRWIALSDMVMRLRGTPLSDIGRAMAAVLAVGVGGFLVSDSTLALFGFRGYSFRQLHVGHQRHVRTRRPLGATLHVLRDIRPRDVIIYHGVPTLTPLRAIWMIAARYASPHRRDQGYRIVRALVHEAHKKRLLTLQSLHDSVEELRDRGRAGTVIMRMVAESLPVGTSMVESRNEDRLTEILAEAGREALDPQAETGDEELIGRVDFKDEALPLRVEVNSIEHHTLPLDRESDEARYERLNAAGFMVGVVWDVDLWRNIGGVLRTVDQARRMAKAGERTVIHSPGCPWVGARICD